MTPARPSSAPDPAAIGLANGPRGALLRRPSARRLQSWRRRLSSYGWRDLSWLVVWMAGLAAIVLLDSWSAEIPLMIAMFGVMLWHSHRRLAANAERARVSQENARLLATQRQFLQDASHQLRTPITIALGHSELLARSLSTDQDKRDINVIVGELNRLRVLSDRLLLIATSAMPDFLRPEPVALDQIMLDVFQRWRPAADRRWQLGRVDPVVAPLDRERLELAVDALLENATQHTSPGDVIGLSVIAEPGTAFVRLAVTDSGPGIAPADVATIFERFASGPAATGRRGTGLGLALVRAVARGHGGEVQVRSRPGSGTTFELLLPVVSSHGGPPGGPVMATTELPAHSTTSGRVGIVGRRLGAVLRKRSRLTSSRMRAAWPAVGTPASDNTGASPANRAGDPFLRAGRP